MAPLSVFLFVTGWMIIFTFVSNVDYIFVSTMLVTHTTKHFLPLSDPSLCVVTDMNDKKPQLSFQLLIACGCGNTESLIVNMKYS